MVCVCVCARVCMSTQVVAWVQTFLPSTQRLLPGATLSDACGCLHALARLRLRPPLEWMEALLEACARQLPRATASQLGTCVWALGELGCDPGQEWLDKACDVSTGVFKVRGVLLPQARLQAPTHTHTHTHTHTRNPLHTHKHPEHLDDNQCVCVCVCVCACCVCVCSFHHRPRASWDTVYNPHSPHHP